MSAIQKPVILDGRPAKQIEVEKGMRVKMLGEKEKDRVGTITALEHQRSRVVIKFDDADKLAVRPSSKVWVLKAKSGKIERIERAVRAGRKPKVEAEAVSA